MGCASSSSSLDAQAMLEKQREIVLQRQKEFELKHSNVSETSTTKQQPIAAAIAATAPANANKSTALKVETGNTPANASSSKSQPPSPMVKPEMSLNKLTDDSVNIKATADRVAPERSPKGTDAEDAVSADARTKYVVDQHDLNARRSKNVHDLAMYGKDVTRRPSFNPRPKESPFTPDMQAAMKAGHEALMAVEAEKKMHRLEQSTWTSNEGAENVPKFEEEHQEPSSKTKAKEEGFGISIKTIGKEEIVGMSDVVQKAVESIDAAPDDPTVAKFVPRDNQDRMSKNIHDLGQYFNRRASFVPPLDGEGSTVRRASFLPTEPPNSRYSYLPPTAAAADTPLDTHE